MFLSSLALLGRQQLNNRIFQHARYFSQELVAGWPENIKKSLEQDKIDKPTLIQEKTLPIAMENKNLVGIARTGSGKTLAFVIPAVMKVLKSREESKKTPDAQDGDDNDGDFKFPRFQSKKATCLVLAPTRELATQTSTVFQKFRKLGLNSISLVGGSSRNEQMRQLQRDNADVYIATPGRLMDLVDSGLVDLAHIKYLVLDEADRMLDMGFEPQIRKIIECIPKERQTLMWSATWPQEIQSLATEFLEDYEYIDVDSENLNANRNIKQAGRICESHDKLRVLLERMKDFKNQCEESSRVSISIDSGSLAGQSLVEMMQGKVNAISIHCDWTQSHRYNALGLFKDQSFNVMVAHGGCQRQLLTTPSSSIFNSSVRSFHAKGSKVRYLDFRYRFNTCHLRSHLLIIRRQKMKKHRRSKWRRKFKSVIAKMRLKREIAKEKSFRVELLTMIKRAEQFDPKEYAQKKIHELNNKPKEPTREERLEELKELIRKNRFQVDYLKPKHRRADI